MSREIRRVPANWQHPTYRFERMRFGEPQTFQAYRPLLDRDYAAELGEWEAEKATWDRGERPEGAAGYTFDQWRGEAPNRESFVPYDVNGELPWWQMYETVSEGTPVSPAFATAEELIDFLAESGPLYVEWTCDGAWPRERAEKFVREEGWFPSMVFSGGQSFTAKEGWPDKAGR